MKRPALVAFAVAVLVAVVLLAFFANGFFTGKPTASVKPPLLFGVDVGYGGEADVERVADAIQGYANLVVLGSLDVTENVTALTNVCDYLYAHGFYFILYIGFGTHDYLPPRGPDPDFFNRTQGRWGDKFLGVYLFDEIGGKQLDSHVEKPVLLDNITRLYVAENDTHYISQAYQASVIGPTAVTLQWYHPPYPNYFMSDYGLYWFDYLSGYNTVFAEFTGNNSRQIAIAMCRGAAHTLALNAGHTTGQEWGAMITWKYQQAPFLEDNNTLYSDMMLAYENGANYIIVFNSPENQTALTPWGTLTQDHFAAMQNFWNYAQTHPRSGYPSDTAYVLPSDYGYGMRSATDTIWGLWGPDNISATVWNTANSLLSTYGNRLDIVYEVKTDGEAITLPYSHLYFWNGTEITK